MTNRGYSPSEIGLEQQGLTQCSDLFWNLPTAELYEHALATGEGKLSSNGALVCSTGEHTGRSPESKFIVDESTSRDVIWWGSVNRRMSEAQFDALHRHVLEHWRDKQLFVRDMYVGADAGSRVGIRVVTETAWHNLFSSQLFIRPEVNSTRRHNPVFTVFSAPTCLADPAVHGTPGGTFIVLHLGRGLILIGGTAYAGEIKKSIFSAMNFRLPRSGVLSMHCSANVGERDDVALFFGLSGTGKTTLSADPDRRLIGDDEHGWNEHSVFNIEGGCYAKCIGLSEELEPQIFSAIRFGTVLENVVLDEASRLPNYASAERTENTRAAYPLEYIPNAVIPSVAGAPKHVVFLACDAFGILPPIAKLTTDQAMYHFLSGYTAKIAGTEKGVTAPKATFSTCFGSPFLPLRPEVYAGMLGEKLTTHETKCWLVNTGWTGGGVGVGKRIELRYTRAIVRAALNGDFDDASFTTEPVFQLAIPKSCPGVPQKLLNPRACWADPVQYDAKAADLAKLFNENMRSLGTSPAEVYHFAEQPAAR